MSKGGYFSVHVRHSVEKNTELLKFMHSTLPLEVYAAASVEAGKALGLYTVHLQTASEDALHAFVAAASRSEPPLRVFYTNNSREVGSRPRDTWGGWVTGREMSEGTVAAVNAYLAMQAPLLISSCAFVVDEAAKGSHAGKVDDVMPRLHEARSVEGIWRW